MKIFDSIRNEKIDFKSLKKDEVTMYVCGPTLYSDIHIGNARPIIFFDVVRRFFEIEGYNVKYVSNITDVDDKIIMRAKKEKKTEEELVRKNINEFDKILRSLNIKEYYRRPTVTDNMKEIISYIRKLVEKKFAYVQNNQVYFDLSKVENYGEISKVKLDENLRQKRISNDLSKKNTNDFLLWKETNEGIVWDSPWGVGRRGWHTECVCMINEIFAGGIDIHGGGADLKFPHHENENAQAKVNGIKLANYWMHNGFVNISDEKMSKSIGNVIYVKDLLKEKSANFIRFLILKNTYTQPINITEDLYLQIEKIETKFNKLCLEFDDVKIDYKTDEIKQMRSIMEDDFNTANLISHFFIKMNSDNITNQDKSKMLKYFIEVLGLEKYTEEALEIPKEIFELIKERKKAKESKNFKLADEIREKIKEKGYLIEDTKEGVKCKKI